MSILLFGTVLDTVAAFAFHIMYTLGNTSQITQCGRHNLLQGFRGKQVAELNPSSVRHFPKIKIGDCKRRHLITLSFFNLGAVVPLPMTDRYADPTVKQSLLG